MLKTSLGMSFCHDRMRRWGLTMLLLAVPVPASAFTLSSYCSISFRIRRGNPDACWDRSTRQAPKPSSGAHTMPGPGSPKYNHHCCRILQPLCRVERAGLAGMEEGSSTWGFTVPDVRGQTLFFICSKPHTVVSTAGAWMSWGSRCVRS